MTRMRGFTLVELMIIVGIIAILAAIAVPAYSRYGYRARRADGQNLLMHIATTEEQNYSSFNKYTNNLTTFGYPAGGAVSEKGYYKATVVTAASNQKFTITATPQGAQASDVCGPLTLDNTGDKQPDATVTAANSNGSCW